MGKSPGKRNGLSASGKEVFKVTPKTVKKSDISVKKSDITLRNQTSALRNQVSPPPGVGPLLRGRILGFSDPGFWDFGIWPALGLGADWGPYK